MSDSRRAALRIVGLVVLVLGLLLFLAETRSSGQSLESFSLTLSPDTASMIGAAAVVLAGAELVCLHFWKRKGTKHLWHHA